MTFMHYVRDTNQYTRDSLTIKDAAYHQLTTYLLTKGLSPQQVTGFIAKYIPTDSPSVTRYTRENREDKHPETVPLDQYFQDVKVNNYALAPTFTAYLDPLVHESFHSKLILKRLDWRTEVKQIAFDMETKGDVIGAEYNNLFQVAIKTGNNSVSGIYGINATPIGNKTAHSTLTSTARIATNTANVLVERMLSGNLLLHEADSASHYVLALMVEYASRAAEIDAAILSANLHIPTVEDVYTYFTGILIKYVYSQAHLKRLKSLLGSAPPMARAFILYAGSLWNIAVYNPDYIKGLLSKMLAPVVPSTSITAPNSILKQSHDGVVNAACHFLYEELLGKGNNFYKMDGSLVNHIASTCVHLYSVLDAYRPTLIPLLLCTTMPPNVAYTRQMARISIIGSDTDSNLKGFMNWGEFYNGHAYPTIDNIKLTAAVGAIVDMVSADGLRQLSVNLGIPRKSINAIDMKSEYTPSSVALSGLTKTYFQTIMVKEKAVLPTPYMIVKGVNLRSSSLPKAIIEKANALMKSISISLIEGKGISLKDTLKLVADIENDVITSVYKGDRRYLRLLKINTPGSYKNDSPLVNNSGWADFWGATPIELPATFVKVPTIMTTKSSLAEWIHSLPEEVKPIVTTWTNARNKSDLPTLYIPEDMVKATGIPEWVRPIIDMHRIVSDVCNIFYIILISLGYYKSKDLMITEDLEIDE